jgi:hypothetical protein
MSFLIVGSKKGIYNESELENQLAFWGVANPKYIINEIIKKRKIVYEGFRIMSLH